MIISRQFCTGLEILTAEVKWGQKVIRSENNPSHDLPRLTNQSSPDPIFGSQHPF